MRGIHLQRNVVAVAQKALTANLRLLGPLVLPLPELVTLLSASNICGPSDTALQACKVPRGSISMGSANESSPHHPLQRIAWGCCMGSGGGLVGTPQSLRVAVLMSSLQWLQLRASKEKDCACPTLSSLQVHPPACSALVAPLNYSRGYKLCVGGPSIVPCPTCS